MYERAQTLVNLSSIELCKDGKAEEREKHFQEREQTLDEPLTCCQ